MTYKEKFEAAENRAHYQNIATKILREMTNLRSLVENSPIAPRRWVWELIQNAKDVHQNDGVKIILDYHKNGEDSFLSFKHSGKPFTADNIRFLIEQISSKDRAKDKEGKPKTTGKFGTGFLTTHLLSEKVIVNGVAKEPELDYRQFELELDRSGFELHDITDSVEKSKDSVQNLDDCPIFKDYIEGAYNTSFNYLLTDEVGHSVAEKGIEDLKRCLPYTFVFVEELKSIRLKHANILFKNSLELDELSDEIKVLNIKVKENDETSLHTFALLSQNLTSIAIPIELNGEQIKILPIDKQIPKLFCDFPLLGTEIFNFPVIINNPNFNPTDPRDGIYLTTSQRANPLSDSNKAYIQDAVQLYFELLEFASKNNWEDLHLLAQIKSLNNCPDWIDENWYNRNVLNPIRTKLLTVDIVKTADNELNAIHTKEGKKYIWFPNSNNQKNRNELWKLCKYWFPHCLPQESDVELWNKLTWKECGQLTSDQLASFIENRDTINKLSEVLIGISANEWLGRFYKFIQSEDTEYDYIINKRAIFPNQQGDLVKKNGLYKDKGDIGEELKIILSELGQNIKSKLLDEDNNFELEEGREIDVKYISREIINEVTAKANDREIAKDYRSPFKRLLVFFKEYPEKSKDLFSSLYRQKHLLYDDEEILDNIQKAEQLNDLLSEFKVENLSEIRALLSKGNANKDRILPVTEGILESMGITTIDEWREAIKDKNLLELFTHESTPTTDMFVYVQGLIEKAKKNVIEVLKALPEYNLDNLDTSTAPTVLAGVLKGDKEISIVVRPAYNNEVIIYYGSERDILDFEPSELWIDDDIEPRQITLGHILKSANIIKFPV
ncbi:MAG: hypothetical protein JW870_13585 [Candidatus Delongbacteria bacterium]|nr:hypothetical protein [Candidatus Delongbacteria bacterium]